MSTLPVLLPTNEVLSLGSAHSSARTDGVVNHEYSHLSPYCYSSSLCSFHASFDFFEDCALEDFNVMWMSSTSPGCSQRTHLWTRSLCASVPVSSEKHSQSVDRSAFPDLWKHFSSQVVVGQQVLYHRAQEPPSNLCYGFCKLGS